MLAFPDSVKSLPNDLMNSFDTSCMPADCSLAVVTTLEGGKDHKCKEFCSELIRWAESGRAAVSDEEAFGSYSKSGVCAHQQDLTLGLSVDLIPRKPDYDLVPDYPALFSKLENKQIIMIGDSIFKQTFEVLPTVFEGTSYQVNTDAYVYDSPTTVHRVKKCEIHFSDEKQTCLYDDGSRKDCNCTAVSQFHSFDTGTTVHFVWGYGIEFPHDDGTLIYGSKFNVVRQALYTKLARGALATIINFGVIPHRVDTEGFVVFLKFVQGWNKIQRVIFSLTFPQHFHTNAENGVGYLDEERIPGGCVDKVVGRHWSDVMATEKLKGVDLIDMYPVMVDRGQYHSVESGNCAEWCLGYDLFYPFWDSITTLIGSEPGKEDQT